MIDSFHIKGLNGLRAVASITVVIGHIELIKNENELDNYFLEIQNYFFWTE